METRWIELDTYVMEDGVQSIVTRHYTKNDLAKKKLRNPTHAQEWQHILDDFDETWAEQNVELLGDRFNMLKMPEEHDVVLPVSPTATLDIHCQVHRLERNFIDICKSWNKWKMYIVHKRQVFRAMVRCVNNLKRSAAMRCWQHWLSVLNWEELSVIRWERFSFGDSS